MDPTWLQIAWFLLVGVLLAGYAILDGFDLGVGILSLTRRDPDDRRIMINAIAPVWDGNEVWLVTGGGALFAAFPAVYATAFSSMYLAVMFLLVALIARAVSMEFRGKVDSPRWRSAWDLAFGLGSLLMTLLLGVAFGNILRGLPLDATGRFGGSFLGLLNPYALLVGLTGVAMFTCHGALFVAGKSEGDLAAGMRRWAARGWVAWVALWAATTAATPWLAEHLYLSAVGRRLVWVAFAVLVLALVCIPIALRAGRLLTAFLASSLAVLATFGLVGASIYPRLIPARPALADSLTIANASSSERTLLTMLVIALLGMPFVIGYTVVIYRVFRGKVRITPDSY